MINLVGKTGYQQPSAHILLCAIGAKQVPGQRVFPHDTLALRFGHQSKKEKQFLEAAEGKPSLLFFALRYGNINAVRDHLLAGKIDLNARLKDHDDAQVYALYGRDLSLLEFSARTSNPESVKALLDYKEKINFDSIDFALLLAKRNAIQPISHDSLEQAQYRFRASQCAVLLEQARKDRTQALPPASRAYIEAAEAGQKVETLAQQSDISFDVYTTALAGAAVKGQRESVEALLRHPYARQLPDVGSVLSQAAFGGHLALVQSLLANHSGRLSLNHLLQASYVTGRTPHAAVKSCLRQAAEAQEASFLQFAEAAKAGDADYIRQVLANPENINIADYVNFPDSDYHGSYKTAALISVAGQGNIPTLEVLLRHKAQMGPSLLQQALAESVRMKQHEAVARLLAAGVAVQKRDGSLLQVACKNNDLKMMDILLQAGISADMSGTRWYWGMDEAEPVYLLELELEQKRYDTAIKLLGAGAQLDKLSAKQYDQFLRYSVENNRDTITQAFIQAGRGYDLLCMAAQLGQKPLVETLLGKGVDPNTDVGGNKRQPSLPPLHGAIEAGHTDIIPLLLAAGADCNLGDKQNRTPLHHAVLKNDLSTVALLLTSSAAAGCEVDLQDEAGDTALMMAARHGFTDVLDRLLQVGAAVNLRNQARNTALIEAVLGNHAEAAQKLLGAGANRSLKNRDRLSALDIATRNPNIIHVSD